VIDQSIIDNELNDLRVLARLDELNDPQFTVENSESGVIIALVRVNGVHTIWIELPEGTPEFEFVDNRMQMNINLVFVAPEYITIILPDGTIERGREVDHHQQNRMKLQLAQFYARSKESQVARTLSRMFPASGGDLVDVRPQRRPRTDNLVGEKFLGLEQLVNSGYSDPCMLPAPSVISYGYCPRCSYPISGTGENEHMPGCPLQKMGW